MSIRKYKKSIKKHFGEENVRFMKVGIDDKLTFTFGLNHKGNGELYEVN